MGHGTGLHMLDNALLGKEILRIRLALKIRSQADLAKAIGWEKSGQSDVSRWERGEVRPGPEVLRKIVELAQKKGVDAESLRTANDSGSDSFRAGLASAAARMRAVLDEIEADLVNAKESARAAAANKGGEGEQLAGASAHGSRATRPHPGAKKSAQPDPPKGGGKKRRNA